MGGSYANFPHPPLCERGVKFRSAADTSLEVESETQRWRAEQVWMDKPAACSEGVSLTQLNKENDVPQEYNKSNMVSLTALAAYMRKIS